MTDLALTTRQPGFLIGLLQQLIDWLNEEVEPGPLRRLSTPEWADLPVYHPIRDDRGGR